MKQVAQRLRDGRIEVLDVPEPTIGPGEILVDVRASVISAGTERTKVVTGRRSLVGKARSRPDQVHQVLDKVRQDGVRATIDAVRMRLDALSPLGYSAAGVVRQVGDRVPGLLPGDRVACAGGGYAVHADLVRVPSNLCVPIPDDVSFDHAAFATIGAIALHGVRQTGTSLGERVCVIGMGLVGQLAGQLLRAAGCTVVGVDLSQDLLDLAHTSGAADHVFARHALSDRLPAEIAECDAVLVTAATHSNDPVELAGRVSRDRGRVVVLGDVHVDVPRALYYDKELEVRLSRSYGPGRYDREYEERGLDYPIGYVRWTERRNLEAFVNVLDSRRVNVEPLISARIPIDNASTAYDRLATGELSPLGLVLVYEPSAPASAVPRRTVSGLTGKRVGLVGAGSFSTRVVIPAMRAAGFDLVAVASAAGLSAKDVAMRTDFGRAATVDELLEADDIDLVVVATRHESHADLTVAALDAGKHVFVEKPPALTAESLARVRAASERTGRFVAVGFNRRYAAMAGQLREYVRSTHAPVDLLYRVNAGPAPSEHWLNDLDSGGGRLLGEGCHFVDFACWVVGSLPSIVTASVGSGVTVSTAESFSIVLTFPDRSLATIMYTGQGAPSLRKEYVEAHAGGRSAIIDDFRELRLYDERGRGGRRSRVSGGKGHAEEFAELVRALSGELPHSVPSPLETMSVTLAARDAASSSHPVRLTAAEDER